MEIPASIVSYEITIKRKTTKFYEDEAEILQEERHYTDKELEEQHHWMIDMDKNEYRKKVYGRQSELKARTDEIEIYKQIINDINLKAITEVVNS